MGSAKSLIEFIDSLLDIAKGIVKKDPDRFHAPMIVMKKGKEVTVSLLAIDKEFWYPTAKALMYLVMPDMVVFVSSGRGCPHKPLHWPVSEKCPNPIDTLHLVGIDRAGNRLFVLCRLDEEGNVIEESRSKDFESRVFPIEIPREEE